MADVREMCRRLASPMGLAGMALLAGIVAMLAMLFRYSDSGYYCSDALECTFQALEMKLAGTLFPQSWTATNFAHLQVLPLYLGFSISPSYVTANRICVLVMFFFSLLSLAVFWRRGVGDRSGLLLSLFYVFPLSGFFMQQLFTGAFYAQFVIGMLFMLAAWLAAFFDGARQSFLVRRRGLVVALVVTFLCCALTGSRMIAVICLPVAGAIVWMSVFDQPYVRGCWRRWMGGVAVAMAVGVVSVLGDKVYASVVMPAFGVPASISCANELMRFVASGDGVLLNVKSICEGIMRMFDFPFGLEMTSPYAMVRTLGFFAATCLYVLFPVLETCAYRRIDGKSRFLVVTAWLSVAVTVFILSFGRLGKGDEWNMCSRYLMLPEVLLLVLGARYAHRAFFTSSDMRRRVASAGLLVVLLLTLFVRWHAVSCDQRAPWNEILARLRDEGLRCGYATYENALPPMFYSEGGVRIPHVVLGEGTLSVPGWCVAERWYDADAYAGPTFLMLTDEELARYAPKGLEETVLGTPTRVLSAGKFKILVYDYNIARDGFGVLRHSHAQS